MHRLITLTAPLMNDFSALIMRSALTSVPTIKSRIKNKKKVDIKKVTSDKTSVSQLSLLHDETFNLPKFSTIRPLMSPGSIDIQYKKITKLKIYQPRG